MTMKCEKCGQEMTEHCYLTKPPQYEWSCDFCLTVPPNRIEPWRPVFSTDDVKHYDEVGNPTEYNRGWNEALKAAIKIIKTETPLCHTDTGIKLINTLKK